MGAAGLVMGLLGLGTALSNKPEGIDVPQLGFRQQQYRPLLFLYEQLGGDLEDLKLTRRKGKWVTADGTEVSRRQRQRIGGDLFAVPVGKFRSKLEEQFQKFSQQQVSSKEALFEQLFGEGGPQFLRDTITNRPAEVRAAFAPRYNEMLASVLGGAAPLGTLDTDAVLQTIGAPTALQAEQFFQSVQDAANRQQLGVLGIPGFGAGFDFDPTRLGAAQSEQGIRNAFTQNFQMNAPLALAGAQSAEEARRAMFGFGGGLMAGGGLYAGMNGGFGNPFSGLWGSLFGSSSMSQMPKNPGQGL